MYRHLAQRSFANARDVAVVTYDPGLIDTGDVLKTVVRIGHEVCRYYGAEVIAHCTAQ
jgi:hypothetical protein